MPVSKINTPFQKLKERVKELEQELAFKDLEIAQLRKRISELDPNPWDNLFPLPNKES